MTPRQPRPELLIAIGDLHGHARALDRILAALQLRHEILGERGGLRAGVRVVTVGDYIDRGQHALEVIARLRRLSRGNGRVVTLLGNHELLALEALDRAAEIAAQREDADPIEHYAATTVHGRNGGGAFVREFGTDPRDALRSYVRRMSRTGDVGRWMRALRPAHIASIAGRRVLFTHGDVPEALREAAQLERYLGRVRRRMAANSLELGGNRAKWRHADLSGDQSIFWDRSFLSLGAGANDHPAVVCRALGVDHIVTGHTPHRQITVYGGRIFRIDVGMTPSYGENEPQALVFTSAAASVVKADGSEQVLVSYPRPDRVEGKRGHDGSLRLATG